MVTKKKKAAPTAVTVKRPRTSSSQIDLGAVAGKYVGETEKNLRRSLAAAQRTSSVLLLDEADALMGKRTEVKDAHDRYANVELTMLKRTSRKKKDD